MTKENVNNQIINLTYEDIKDKIYIIRGREVMIDSDLAKIYGYTTKDFNRQVKNNIEKFDSDFMFQLSDDEILKLSRCNFFTSMQTKGIKGGRVYNPYAFTEQGIYMLMTVLKGKLATIQSKNLIRIFKGMKDYIIFNDKLTTNELLKLSNQTYENTKDIKVIKNDIKNIMTNFIDKNRLKEKLILDGEVVEADIAYSMIFSLAKESIYIIDNYIGLKTLILLKKVIVPITIFTCNINKGLHKLEYQDFIKEYSNVNITFKRTNNMFHDRYIVIDYNSNNERIYHLGTSIKDSGKRVTTIMEIEDTGIYHALINKLNDNNNFEF